MKKNCQDARWSIGVLLQCKDDYLQREEKVNETKTIMGINSKGR